MQGDAIVRFLTDYPTILELTNLNFVIFIKQLDIELPIAWTHAVSPTESL